MKQVSLPITNDTYVFTGLPNNNFYQKPHLKVGYLNTYEFMGYFYTLIKFDLATLGELSYLEEAYLVLFVEYISPRCNENISLTLNRNISDFTPETVTAATLPETSSVDSLTTLVCKYNENKYIKINITNFIREWANGTVPNYGFTISLNNQEQQICFSSSSSLTAPYVELFNPLIAGPTGATGPQGIQGDIGPTGPNGLVGAFGYVYDLQNSNIPPFSDVIFSNSGPLSNLGFIPGSSPITIVYSGTYQITYSINVLEGTGGVLAIDVNGTANPSTQIPILTTPSEVSGTAILTLLTGDSICLYNPSITPLTIATSPNIGAQLNIIRLI